MIVHTPIGLLHLIGFVLIVQATTCGASWITSPPELSQVVSTGCPAPMDVVFNSGFNSPAVDVACSGGDTIHAARDIFAPASTPFIQSTVLISANCDVPRGSIRNTASGDIYLACATGPKQLYNGVIKISGTTHQATPLTTTSQCVTPVGPFAINPVTGVVYVACFTSSTIISISPSDAVTVLTTSTQCTSPNSVAYHVASGTLYGACAYPTKEAAIVIPSNGKAPFPAGPVAMAKGVAVNPTTGYAYIAVVEIGVVEITPTGAQRTVVPTSLCLSPYAVAVNDVTQTLYVTCQNNQGAILGWHIGSSNSTITNTDFLQSSSTFNCRNPISLSIDSFHDQLYVACVDSNNIWQITNQLAFSSSSSGSASNTASSTGQCMVTRQSLSSSVCSTDTNSCNYKCSQGYTIGIVGNTASLLPNTVQGCNCDTGSATVSATGDALTSGTFSPSGSTFTAAVTSQKQIQVLAQVQGSTCTGTYSVTSGSCLGVQSASQQLTSGGITVVLVIAAIAAIML